MWLDEALNAALEAREERDAARESARVARSLHAISQAEARANADAAAEAGARASLLALQLQEAAAGIAELQAEIHALWEANDALQLRLQSREQFQTSEERLERDSDGAALAAEQRAERYKNLARTLHNRLRDLTTARDEELQFVRASLRSAHATASEGSTACPVTPLPQTLEKIR